MSDPVEVIARAILRSRAHRNSNEPTDQEPPAWALTQARTDARVALAALEGEGMVVVPVEATEEMLVAGGKAIMHVQGWGGSVAAGLCWRTMIRTR